MSEKAFAVIIMAISLVALFETRKDEYKIRRNGKPLDVKIMHKKVNVAVLWAAIICVLIMGYGIVTLSK